MRKGRDFNRFLARLARIAADFPGVLWLPREGLNSALFLPRADDQDG
jgi:hypothetical protein